MTHSPYPYVLSDGMARIADDWNNHVDKNLAHIINLDENRQRPSSGGAWTGTSAIGTPFTGYTCGGWTTSGSGLSGVWGPIVGTSACWSKCGSLNCNRPSAIYCVQQ